MPTKPYYLGIDLGGTKMLAAIVDDAGKVLCKEEQPTNAEQGENQVLTRLVEMSERLVSSYSETEGEALSGIGIASAGTLDAQAGVIMFAGNLGWRNVPIAALLAERYPCRVRLINDGSAAAYGEWKAGAGKGTNHCVYVTVSTGIGGGVVSEGRLLLGTSGSAGELGHITIDWKGPPCVCGNRGCLESYASGTAIARKTVQDIREGNSDAIQMLTLIQGNIDKLSAKMVASAAAAKDPYAIRIMEQAGMAMGAGLVSMIHLFNPEVIVYGGGVSQSGDAYLTPMVKTANQLGMKEMMKDVAIVPAALGPEAGAIGAALYSGVEWE